MKRLFVITLLCVLAAAMRAQVTETLWLSGRGGDDTKTWQFTVSDGMRRGKTSKIQVPSCWEQQGFGDYTYGRWYTIRGGRPSKEEGLYSLAFSVPKEWRGRKVEIVFEGVMTDATVRVNGQRAGAMHQGAFTAFSYDISDKLRYGRRNRLEVAVQKESADRSINAAERKADWWLFGGIYRPVYLTAKPRHHIVRATTSARADGTLRIQLLSKAGRGARLRAAIEGLGERTMEIAGDSCIVETSFKGARLWDTEHPNLYNLRLQLVAADGTVEHEICKRVGFRTVEFRYHDGFYLNGTKLLIKGVNRHCFYPETGRTTSRREDVEDVRLIKAMNANAIRSHYPPDAHLLDICDSLGVLYLNELAGWQNAYSTSQGARILREMVTHDASHPCIFAWSNGNEGGFNYALDSLFAKYDPQGRHVVHAWALWDGVDAHHYPAFQTGVDRLKFGQQVFMPTEFLHAQYDKGAGASLYDFWTNWRQNPLFAGGFIWAWADEGIARRDRNGAIDTDGPNGPDGIVGPYREKEGSWFAIRDIWSPLQIEPLTVNKSWNGRITMRNEQLFSKLDECRLFCGNKEVALPPAKPGEAVSLTLPQDAGAGEILSLTATNAAGDTINIWTWPTKTAKEHFAQTRPTLSSGSVTAEFDEATGMLAKLAFDGKEIPFNNGPVPVGFKMQFKGGYHATEGDDRLYVAKYAGAVDSIVWRLTPDGLLGMEAVLFNDKKGHGYEGSFIEENARTFGFSFSYPESECRGMRWMGKGPYRVWRNRLQGQNFGVWEKAYNNTVTGELPEDSATWSGKGGKPQQRLVYPEFKGYHANIYWAEIESATSPFTIYSETDGLYLRLFTPQEPVHRRNGQRTMERFPQGDISFLIDIAPIQSYKPLEQLGPTALVPTVRINLGDEGVRIKVWVKK